MKQLKLRRLSLGQGSSFDVSHLLAALHPGASDEARAVRSPAAQFSSAIHMAAHVAALTSALGASSMRSVAAGPEAARLELELAAQAPEDISPIRLRQFAEAAYAGLAAERVVLRSESLLTIGDVQCATRLLLLAKEAGWGSATPLSAAVMRTPAPGLSLRATDLDDMTRMAGDSFVVACIAVKHLEAGLLSFASALMRSGSLSGSALHAAISRAGFEAHPVRPN